MPGEIRHKEFRFPVQVVWHAGRRTTARVDGKAPLRIATPPEFRGTDPDIWSPEDAFVAAAASCLAVTIAALAEHEQLPVRGLSVRAEGVVGRRPDGRFGFVRIEQTVELKTDHRYEGTARRARREGRGHLPGHGVARPAGRNDGPNLRTRAGGPAMSAAMDSDVWNRRYADRELVWTSEPNRFLVAEAAALPAGRALDLACGEGRNAVWLAERGWRVTGVDFSEVGLEKARALARARGVQAEWVAADLLAYTPEPQAFELVLVFYLQVPAAERQPIVRAAAGAVAPGGLFLLVGSRPPQPRARPRRTARSRRALHRRRRRRRPRRRRP